MKAPAAPPRRPLPASLLWGGAAILLLLSLGTPDPGEPPAGARILVPRLGAATAAERDEAEAGLARLGDAAAEALAEAAASADPEVRNRARSLLSRLRGGPVRRKQEALADFVAAGAKVESLAPGTQVDARLRAIGPESGEVLAWIARRVAEREIVSGTLARALVRHASAESLAALATVWRNDRLLPSAALDAARDLDAVRRSPHGTRELRETAAAGIALLGDPLAAPEAPRRRAGLALLASFAGAGAADTILRAAADPDAGVRREAARILARHLPGDGLLPLHALAADRDATVRVAALESLRTVGGVSHPEPAVAAAGDDTASVRRAAAELLGREATADELPVLRRLETDPSLMVRAAARRSLVALGVEPGGRGQGQLVK